MHALAVMQDILFAGVRSNVRVCVIFAQETSAIEMRDASHKVMLHEFLD